MTTKQLYKLSIIPFLLLLCVAGCGYSTRSLISSTYKTIHVRAFANKIDITKDTSVARQYQIYHPLLENDLTRKVIDQFILDVNLRISNEDDADLILEGELVNYRKEALRYTGEEDREIEEYRIYITVNLKLYDTQKQAFLWELTNFTGDSSYFTQGTLSKSESQAIDDAISDVARRIVNRVVDVW